MDLYTTTGTLAGHAGRGEYVGGRYPFRPVCSCGDAFRGYVAEHAAQTVLEAHLNEEEPPTRIPDRYNAEGPQTRMLRLQNIIAGRAGGTASEGDVTRWQGELDELRAKHGTPQQQRAARVAAARAVRAAQRAIEGPISRFPQPANVEG